MNTLDMRRRPILQHAGTITLICRHLAETALRARTHSLRRHRYSTARSLGTYQRQWLIDSTFYDNVIDAMCATATCRVHAQHQRRGREQLGAAQRRDIASMTTNNVDLNIVRTAFDAIPGVNRTVVAWFGLECIYDGGLRRSGAMFADLF